MDGEAGRGFVFGETMDPMIDEAKEIVLEVVNGLKHASEEALHEVKREIEKRLKKFFYGVIERRPLIMPVIIQV